MDSQKLILISIFFLIQSAQSITFTVRNNCPYTVWPAAVPIGGGRQLSTGQTWTFNTDHHLAHIWARTNCSFNSAGRGSCLTGDCNGLLSCQTTGSPPHTRADYGLNTFNHQDYYTVSVMQGFNVPIQFTPLSNGCTRSISCRADLTTQCPSQLRAPGGCNNPCTVYGTTQYCCHSGVCRPTDLSRFFKARCREAFTFPEDDPTSTFLCPAGTNYRVTFCP